MLNDSATGAVAKKVGLLQESFGRFAVRAVLAGIYLTVGTAFAGAVGTAFEPFFPGLGSIIFACLFGLGLFAIIILGGELATGNMMYMVYGAVNKQVSWGRGLWVILVTTVFNLVGAIIFAAAMGLSVKLGEMGPAHVIVSLTDGKLGKSVTQMLVEGAAANFIVNMAIVGATFAKDMVSKFFVIVPLIATFVGLGLEHVIANFSLFMLTLFGAVELPLSMDLGSILLNWSMVWIGNLIGGGFLIGGVYAWLNRGQKVYRD